MRSRVSYLITSITLHGALFIGLYLLTQQRERGIGADFTVVELSLIPGLEQLLDDATPTGSETAEDVTPEPIRDSDDSIPERVVERPDPEPASPEPVAELPEPAAIEVAPSEDVAEPPVAAELAEATPPTTTSDTEVETRAIETDLEATDLLAIVVTAERRNVLEPQPDPVPEPEAERVTTAISVSEQEILEQHVATWSESFVALAEWQPNKTWIVDNQEYSASVTRVPAPDNMGVEEAVVTVTTQRDGATFSTEMRMQRLGFSHFAQFIDRWDSSVQIHDDRIDGRFHSNSEINISRSGGVQPVFHGKVTTARGINTASSERRVRRDEVFLGGLETRVRRIVLPRRVTLFEDEETIPAERVRRFAIDTRIEFLADGSFTWSAVDEPEPTGKQLLGTAAYYLVAEDDVELYVRGVVNGKVLVYSPADIVIEGNLVYASDPTTEPASDDYLGLVSERSVEVADSQVTGPGDLSIQASIYARVRFAVRGYRTRNDGTLFLHGSLTAGSLTATEPRFSTHLSFDDRLDAARPPSFPVTDRFEIAEWDGRWIVDD